MIVIIWVTSSLYPKKDRSKTYISLLSNTLIETFWNYLKMNSSAGFQHVYSARNTILGYSWQMKGKLKRHRWNESISYVQAVQSSFFCFRHQICHNALLTLHFSSFAGNDITDRKVSQSLLQNQNSPSITVHGRFMVSKKNKKNIENTKRIYVMQWDD